MNSVFDYESLGRISFDNVICETYDGVAIVQWAGKIERQLQGLLADAEKGRNYTYADKIREFLKIWRQTSESSQAKPAVRCNEAYGFRPRLNEGITGSLNREDIEPLKTAAGILAVDSWKLSSYFGSLRDQLNMLIASEEALPRGVDANQNDPMAGMGGGGGAPPMSPSFGAEEEAPEGLGGEGDVPPGGGGGEMPGGAEGTAPEDTAGAGLDGEEGAEGAPDELGVDDMPDEDNEDETERF